jgi:hypothetical protein
LEGNTEADNPPTKYLVYFDFYLTAAKVDTWVTNHLVGAKYAIITPATMVNFAMNDEYGYRFDILLGPGGSLDATANPGYSQDFLKAWHAFMQDPAFGLTPALFGAPNWNAVQPLAAMPDAYPVPDTLRHQQDRAIFYWTSRFLQISAIRGFKMTIEALLNKNPNLAYPYANLSVSFGTRGAYPSLTLDWFFTGAYGTKSCGRRSLSQIIMPGKFHLLRTCSSPRPIPRTVIHSNILLLAAI